MKSYDIVGYAYDADLHCTDCTLARFNLPHGQEVHQIDSEGNQLSPIFVEQCDEDDYCGDCFVNLLTGDLPEWVNDETMPHYLALTGQEVSR